MTHRGEEADKPAPPPVFTTPPAKRLRFRGDLNLHHFESARLDDLFDEPDGGGPAAGGAAAFRRGGVRPMDPAEPASSAAAKAAAAAAAASAATTRSFSDFLKIELTRGYVLEHDEERYSARRQKIYTFMKIPRELEKFMVYGVLQCVDSFLYIHTFLPIRYLMAVWACTWRPLATCFGWRRRGQRLLSPAEICDLLKGSIWIIATLLILSVDTNRMYHIIKSQSVIKLYIFYNMLEVGDRLLSAFGQDTIDALFWTATEPKEQQRSSRAAHLGVIAHIVFALTYIILHSGLIMLQATALNVAINSNNKGLLAIMMSNNFVELKGSVFKKFDKNNLFQLTCSDVRERVHLTVLLFVVVIQTMKEFNWRAEQFFVLLPDCCYVLLVEVLIDWLKHAFITRFNELPADVYKEYTISLAYDMTQTRQKHAFSDHSDLVSRRMGFIPYPLGIVLIKALYTAVSFDSLAAVVLFVVAFVTLLTCRILNTICALGKACDLMQKHQEEKLAMQQQQQQQQTPMTGGGGGFGGGGGGGGGAMNGIGQLGQQTQAQKQAMRPNASNQPSTGTADASNSPMHSYQPLQRSKTVDIVGKSTAAAAASSGTAAAHLNHSAEPPRSAHETTRDDASPLLLLRMPEANLGATALFSNSDVDLDDACLNEKLLQTNCSDEVFEEAQSLGPAALTRSVPDLSEDSMAMTALADCGGGGGGELADGDAVGGGAMGGGGGGGVGGEGGGRSAFVRTHKRSESEPSMQCDSLTLSAMTVNTAAAVAER